MGFMVQAGSGQSTRCRLGLLMGDQEDCSASACFIGIGCEGDVREANSAMGREENDTTATNNQMRSFEVTAGGRAANGDEWPMDVEVMIQPASGAFYVADTENHAIRRIDRTTGLIRTVAG